MSYERVCAVYFSATGTTKKIVTAIAGILTRELSLKFQSFDFTKPEARTSVLSFSETDIVVFGTPVVAGRVPNLLLGYMNKIEGKGALAVPIVLYGNRDFDDALIELNDILTKDEFKVIGGGAFVGEHSFSNKLAKGRPDDSDIDMAKEFGETIAEKIKKGNPHLEWDGEIEGTPHPYRGYYHPKDNEGNIIDIRKVFPITDCNCINCKLCTKLCPMGSIDYSDVSIISGVCMKCCSCIKNCPVKAKHFDDHGFLYHKKELEEMFKRRGDNRCFY